ncbi:hypothetical protein GEMRC1_002680 [Eukaryota sp. GEM-RC1]
MLDSNEPYFPDSDATTSDNVFLALSAASVSVNHIQIKFFQLLVFSFCFIVYFLLPQLASYVIELSSAEISELSVSTVFPMTNSPFNSFHFPGQRVYHSKLSSLPLPRSSDSESPSAIDVSIISSKFNTSFPQTLVLFLDHSALASCIKNFSPYHHLIIPKLPTNLSLLQLYRIIHSISLELSSESSFYLENNLPSRVTFVSGGLMANLICCSFAQTPTSQRSNNILSGLVLIDPWLEATSHVPPPFSHLPPKVLTNCLSFLTGSPQFILPHDALLNSSTIPKARLCLFPRTLIASLREKS